MLWAEAALAFAQHFAENGFGIAVLAFIVADNIDNNPEYVAHVRSPEIGYNSIAGTKFGSFQKSYRRGLVFFVPEGLIESSLAVYCLGRVRNSVPSR